VKPAAAKKAAPKKAAPAAVAQSTVTVADSEAGSLDNEINDILSKLSDMD
jgi:hypothetical protein